MVSRESMSAAPMSKDYDNATRRPGSTKFSYFRQLVFVRPGHNMPVDIDSDENQVVEEPCDGSFDTKLECHLLMQSMLTNMGEHPSLHL